MNHDQNFKNLILDYPRQALAFFAAEEAGGIDQTTRILPVRQEQLQERLGERFRELDVPLLVEWPDGRREAVLFVVEEESDPRRFSIHRLAHYCLDLAELLDTTRVVPVVIFLCGTAVPRELLLGGDRHQYLRFHYLACELASLSAESYLHSDNLVARLNLPNMAYPAARKPDVYGQAVQGLLTLEADPERQAKYVDFIDIYAALNDNDRRVFQERYPDEVQAMSAFAERFTERGLKQGLQQGLEQGKQQGLQQGLEQGKQQGLQQGLEQGKQQGLQQGLQQGEAAVLVRLLERKFGVLTESQRRRIETADAETLLSWSERILTAQSPDEVLR